MIERSLPLVVCLACLAIGTVLGGTASPARADDVKTRSITVVGVGRERGAPDTVGLQFAVEHTAPTAAAASQGAAKSATAVMEALRKDVGTGGRVETAGFNLHPVYRPQPPEPPVAERGPRPPEIVAYTATNEISVETHQVAGVGGLIDGGIAAGAARVSGLSFTIDNPAPVRALALKAAGLDAATQAGAIAESLKVTLGSVLEASTEWTAIPVQHRFAAMRADAAMASTPIEPGEVTTEARLRVTYAIQ